MRFEEIKLNKSDEEIASFAKELNVSNTFAKILLQRNIDTVEKFNKYINPGLQDMRDPFLLNNMNLCHNRIQKAIDNNERVLIYGDYDVDGISAVAILYKFLKDKISNIDCFLPNRYEDGYGLTLESSKKIIDLYKPNLIITVDCGITSVEETEYIKSCGVDIIITDHHEPQEQLPETIVVDPKIKNQQYGFDGICGAGVALKVVETFVGRNNLDEYLPICAIATVSDIVPLIDENRAIVTLGLKLQDNLPEGVKMLIKHSKIDNLNSQAISFKIAPKLNAAGRMGSANYSLDLYISNDRKTLNSSLKIVDELNIKRQKLSQQIYEDCLEIIKEKRLYTNRAIIVSSKKWDSGLLGIACARLVEDFCKPVFLFSEEDGELKGSVRSIEKINIHEVLSSCSDFLETFGGHSMAAGLALKVENYDKFQQQIYDYLNKNTTEEIYIPVKRYETKILPEEVNESLVNELKLLEPVGCENPSPIFLTEYEKCFVSRTQNYSNHLNIIANNSLKLIAFNADRFLDDYEYATKKSTIFEIQSIKFKNKLIIKGIVKNTIFSGFSNELENISNGRILKQFIGNTYYGDIEYFTQYELKTLLDKLLKTNSGTAIVIYNKSTLEKFKSTLDLYDLNYYVGGSQSKFEENSVVFAMEDLDSIKNYKNLVFLDTLLDTNFLSGSNNKIFAIKNQPSNIEKLFLTRDNFAVIYKAIVEVIKSQIYYSNEIELYNLIRRINPQLFKMRFAQFISALYTFLELGMLKFDKKFEYHIYIDEKVRSKLENSSFYNKLNFISKVTR